MTWFVNPTPVHALRIRFGSPAFLVVLEIGLVTLASIYVSDLISVGVLGV